MAAVQECQLDVGAYAAADGRAPRETAAWTEHYINSAKAVLTRTPTEAMVQGCSALVLPALATEAECCSLVTEAKAAANKQHPREVVTNSTAVSPASCHTRSHLWSRELLPVVDSFGDTGQNLCNQLLLRAIDSVRAHHPQLYAILFGKSELSSVLGNESLSFATEEPAVNVYYEGGQFVPHEDKYSLTVLVALSSPADFDGGGTAFWPVLNHAASLKRQTEPERESPALVLKPPAGSALLFTGDVTHAGMPVCAGERCMLVASFSLKHEYAPRNPCEGDEARRDWEAILKSCNDLLAKKTSLVHGSW